MSTVKDKNIINFHELKKRSERLRKNRRMAEMKDRFERAMGWEEKALLPSDHTEKAAQQQRR